MPITLLDGILVGFTLVSAMLAMVRGFSREILSIASWGAAAVAAYFFYPAIVPYIESYVDHPQLRIAVAAAIVFFIALIVVTVITMKIADFIIDSRIGALDRTLGFIFGAVRGLLLVVVAMLFFNWLAPENQPDWIAGARSKPFLDNLGQQLVAALPDNPEEVILDSIRGPQDADGVPEGTATPGEPTSIEGVIEGTDTPAQPAN